MNSKLSKWTHNLKGVAVEPAAVFLMTSVILTNMVYQNFIIESVCHISRNNSQEVCQQIVKVNATFHTEEIEIQKVVADVQKYSAILDNVFKLIFILLIGPVSDYYGRKWPMVVSLVGSVFASVVMMIFALYYHDTISPYLVGVIMAVSGSLLGGEVSFQMAAYSYLCDTTDHKSRTFRLGIFNASYQLGIPLGYAVSGVLLSADLGYSKSFAISAGLSAVSVVIVLFKVHERTSPKPDISYGKFLSTPTPNEGVKKILNFREMFFPIFLPFKNRLGYDRLKIWLLLISYVCIASTSEGEGSVIYLFVRERLGWDGVLYGQFSIYNAFMSVTGVTMSMGILNKWLKLDDPVIGFISGIGQLGACFVYAFAFTTTMMYIGPAVDMMNGTVHVVARSMLTKIVNQEEIGQIISLISILGALVPLASSPGYSLFYKWTVDIFSGYFYILSSVLSVPPLLIFMWFIWKKKSDRLRIWSRNNNSESIPILKEKKDYGTGLQVSGATGRTMGRIR